MPIYKYTMKKYFRSMSTWIILGITAVVVFVITGPLFFKQLTFAVSVAKYQRFADAFLAGILLLIVLFGSIFIGFKGGQVYKDEVEDGTFLIILSKPQSRSRIIFFKWLALSTMSVVFLVTVLLAMTLGVTFYGREAVMSEGVNISLYHNLIKNNLIIFGLGLVIVMILSSIALMISTKVSTGATIGITIAIGVSVQITGIIGQFSTTTTYNTKFIETNIKGKGRDLVGDMERKDPKKASRPPDFYKGVGKIIETLYTGALGDQTKVGSLTIPGGGLAFVGINVNTTPTFDFLSYIDLSYQVSLLSNIATTAANNRTILNTIDKTGGPGNIKKQKFVKTFGNFGEIVQKVQPLITLANLSLFLWAKQNNNAPYLLNKGGTALLPDIKLDWSYLINVDQLKIAGNEANVSLPVPKSGAKKNDTILSYMVYLGNHKKLDEIQYVDFINRYAVLSVYIILATILVPVSYFILKRQDFR